MKVSSYMTAKVVTAAPEDGVRHTFFRMRENRVRHLPVVDEGGKLVGFISDRDLRRPDWVDEAIDLAHAYKLEDDLQVRDLMTTNLVVAHTYDPIAKIVDLLIEHRFGALPVLDKGENLVGIISAIDLLRAFADTLAANA
ncbi:MAG: CBS domain-containing protein [Myxococcales bacterium]|nr:CBS domain-containing protein [Myxococcales bacterium]